MTTRRLFRDLRHIKCCGQKKGTEIFGKQEFLRNDELTPYLHQNYEVPNEWPHKTFKVSNNHHAVVVNYNENWERYCFFFFQLCTVKSYQRGAIIGPVRRTILFCHITKVFSYDYRNEKRTSTSFHKYLQTQSLEKQEQENLMQMLCFLSLQRRKL